MNSSKTEALSSENIGKSAFRFSIGTFLSRISGAVREMMMAYVLGATVTAAGFLIAFRFAYLLRRIFGEGALMSGFIPYYETLKVKDPKEAALFFRDLTASLILVLLGVIGVIELFLFFYLHSQTLSPETHEVVYLTMVSLPGLLFICLFALHSGFLQCEGRFFLTGVAPAAFNIAWIGTLFFFRSYAIETITTYLAFAIDIAFLAQLSMLLPATWKKIKGYLAWKESIRCSLFSPYVRKMIRAVSLSVIGVSAMQVNGFIDVLFARMADAAGPAHLTYAIRLEQMPLALFGIAIVSAFFPPFSRALESGNQENAKALLESSINKIILLMIPCSIAFFALGEPLIELLFGRGLFSMESTIQTSHCLFGYAIGLIPGTLVLLFNQAFYAKRDFITPMLLAVLTIVLNACFNLFFIFQLSLGSASVAVATSLTAIINATILYLLYTKKHSSLSLRGKRKAFFRLTMAAVFAATLSSVVATWLGAPTLLSILKNTLSTSSRVLSSQILQFFVPSCVFLVTFFLFSLLFRVQEVLDLFLCKIKKTPLTNQ